MLLARTRWLRCAPWRLGRPATLSGGTAGLLAAARAKRGAASNAPSGAEQPAEQAAATPQQPEDAATVPDLSRHVPVGEQWQPAALPQQWVAFSDLHVSHKNRATTLAVLERVHEEAARRGAGILFLGDFWHTRGTLPVEPLNEVVQELAGWRQPTLMLPGNHDQVSLGGQVHALTPLAAANPAIHAFDGPALFLDALWLPYRRDPAALEAALAAASEGQAPLRAVFAHADIVGAMMNEAYQAHDGLPPELFPAGIPTYTGHYHKPHTVAGTRITYIGSPYQVTRAEAGQRKRLLLLDRAAGWEAVDQLPLDAGPRYFVAAAARVAAPAESAEVATAAAEAAAGDAAAEAAVDATAATDEAAAGAAAGEVEAGAEPVFELELPEGLRRGDRLLLTLPAAAAKQHAKQLRKLEKQGIEVEVFTPPEAAAAPRIAAAEGMGPLQLWSEYCAWQRLPPPAAEAGAGLLRGLLGGAMGGTPLEQPHAAVEFEAVEVEGYFSFRDPVRYELGRRGLVVVTGQVHDTAEAGVESNGAGKTALMMAPLWALTGSVDSRAEGASAARPVLADIIHDGSKRARVRVEGRVNGAPFWVERTANKKASSVAFHLDGEDLTTQENRLTQARIDEVLGADLLGRVVFYGQSDITALLEVVVFYGQSDITALLEASDRAFKQELAKLVDLRVWEAAKEASRRELGGRRDALRDAAATLRERQQQAGTLKEQLQGLQAAAAEWEQQAADAAAELSREAGLLVGQVLQQQAAADAAATAGQQRAADLQGVASQLAEQMQRLEAQLASEQRGASELAAAEQQLAEQQASQRSLQEQQQQWSRQLGAASAALEEAGRQQAAAREAAAAASAALSAFSRQHPDLAAGSSGSSSGGSGAAGEELEELLGRQQLLSRELQQAEGQLTSAREAAAAQRSRLQAKQEAAQRAQHEAESAAAEAHRQRAAVQASDAAEALSLQDVKKQRRSMQRRLGAAQQRLGAAQGQARERVQQLEEYRALVASGGSSTAGGSKGAAAEENGAGTGGGGKVAGTSGGGKVAGVAVLEPPQQQHEHGNGAAVCDRCAQPISPELFQLNVERLEAAAAAAAAKAAKEERQIAALERAAVELEAAAAAAEQAAHLQAALDAAEAAAAARAAEADAANAEAEHAAVAAQESEGLVADAQQTVDDLHAPAAQLATAISAAEAAADLEQQRQELLWAAGNAAQTEASVAQRQLQAERQQAQAAAELEGLEAAATKAAASVAALHQQVQRLGQGHQEAVLLRSQQQAAQQQLRLQQQQLDALADLGRQLEAVALELGHLGSSSSSDDSASTAAAGSSSGDNAAEDIEAAAAAARSTLAAAADLQQRWCLQQQQPNLPARDAALVQQQLEAAEAAAAEVEQRHAELEDEVGVWKQVDDALLPRGVPNFVVEGVLGDLQAAASRNLGALTSGMALTLSPCKPAGKRKDAPEGGTIEQIEKIVHVRQPGSLEMRQRSVRQLSGGERRRVALALALGFSELAAQRGRLRSNLIVLDEVMQHLDGEGCLRVAQLLKQLPYSSVLVVAQAHSLQTQVFDATDVVVKSGGHSTVEQGSSAAIS
ncbi:ABC transporter (ISS) isoform C [Chlorella sorokiniana]|uniref:ABC transporter (ISS) isoform C n=1 Tax=Chlorella sorokiniana TaxID=3076 RepID=A0A2P6TLS9_CHLSO|nr:ABC transporter (ISS) isoform C [Chlorella sorokiniana]|eukprot:PRW45242.1 ABC transporter (ISS) isoform C [Chlorella sorokiniana]